jgi:hypothetical protein
MNCTARHETKFRQAVHKLFPFIPNVAGHEARSHNLEEPKFLLHRTLKSDLILYNSRR